MIEHHIKSMVDYARHMLLMGRRQHATIANAIQLADQLRANTWPPAEAARIMRRAARDALYDNCPYLAAHMDLIADALDPDNATLPAPSETIRPPQPRRIPAAPILSKTKRTRGQPSETPPPPKREHWWDKI